MTDSSSADGAVEAAYEGRTIREWICAGLDEYSDLTTSAEIHAVADAMISAIADTASRTATAALMRAGNDVAAALSAFMENCEVVDVEAVEHCNAMIERWVELVQPAALTGQGEGGRAE